MSWVSDVYTAVGSIFKGLKVTITEFFRPSITLQYPDQRWELPKGYRGMPVLLVDEEGRLKCTACGACQRACPLGIIEIETKKDERGKRVLDHFRIDFSRCMVCNLCVEACGLEALAMADAYERSVYDPKELVFDEIKLVEAAKKHNVAGVGGQYGTTL